MKWLSWSSTVIYSASWGSPCSTPASEAHPWACTSQRASTDCMDKKDSDVSGYPRWRAGLLKAVLLTATASLAACSRRSHVLNLKVFYDRMQRTLRFLTIWLNQAEGLCCFPSLRFHAAIYTTWYRWLNVQSTEGENVHKKQWRFKK